MADLQIPVKEYFRPDGRSETKEITITNARTDARIAAIELLSDEEIDLTIERWPHMVNICLDNGDFDYKYETVAPDLAAATILRLLDEFDLEDYRRAVSVMADQL